jgi:hypothetical protein
MNNRMDKEMKMCIVKGWVTEYIVKLIREDKNSDFKEVLTKLANDIHLKIDGGTQELKEVGDCILCLNKYSNWGHNPDPIPGNPGDVAPRVCDDCNKDKVIPLRLARLKLMAT